MGARNTAHSSSGTPRPPGGQGWGPEAAALPRWPGAAGQRLPLPQRCFLCLLGPVFCCLGQETQLLRSCPGPLRRPGNGLRRLSSDRLWGRRAWGSGQPSEPVLGKRRSSAIEEPGILQRSRGIMTVGFVSTRQAPHICIRRDRVRLPGLRGFGLLKQQFGPNADYSMVFNSCVTPRHVPSGLSNSHLWSLCACRRGPNSPLLAQGAPLPRGGPGTCRAVISPEAGRPRHAPSGCGQSAVSGGRKIQVLLSC